MSYDELTLENLDKRVGTNNELIVTTKRDLEALEDRIAALEQLVDPDPGAVDYDQLTRPQKIYRVRRALVERAATNGGTASMQYDDVMWLFDGHPSAGHCYNLMERAATLDGFAYDEAGNGRGQKRIRVVLDGVNDERLLHAVNNGESTAEA